MLFGQVSVGMLVMLLNLFSSVVLMWYCGLEVELIRLNRISVIVSVMMLI